MEKPQEQEVRRTVDNSDPWRLNEEASRRQVREDAKRPLAENLAETLALSEFVGSFAGSARRQ